MPCAPDGVFNSEYCYCWMDDLEIITTAFTASLASFTVITDVGIATVEQSTFDLKVDHLNLRHFIKFLVHFLFSCFM